MTTRIKIVSIGEMGTGKSSIIKRYCENRFEQRYKATVGIDYGVKDARVNIDGQTKDVRVNFWDFSGDPDYLEVRNEFYSDVGGFFLVYDVSSQRSFSALNKWLSEARHYGVTPDKAPIILCANKTDKEPRQVSKSRGSEFAANNRLLYFETSAQSGKNISDMFQCLFRAVMEKSGKRGKY